MFGLTLQIQVTCGWRQAMATEVILTALECLRHGMVIHGRRWN